MSGSLHLGVQLTINLSVHFDANDHIATSLTSVSVHVHIRGSLTGSP